MSEFDSSNKEVHDACGISLPPKDVVNGYIEGVFLFLVYSCMCS